MLCYSESYRNEKTYCGVDILTKFGYILYTNPSLQIFQIMIAQPSPNLGNW